MVLYTYDYDLYFVHIMVLSQVLLRGTILQDSVVCELLVSQAGSPHTDFLTSQPRPFQVHLLDA